ncbi:MAG: hypothetical protein II949_09290 [Prevotella sp.]|jgi:hypothetical protein|nr:hypothetical protein [Prevotella sp.]
MRRIIVFMMGLLLVLSAAGETRQSRAGVARATFDRVYDKVFGDQGASLRYDVNIIGIYKTSGTIWYKGKKQRFSDERVDTWNDGRTAYMVYRKKKTVEIHDANSDKKDKYSGKFKFSLDDFDYDMEQQKDGLLLKLKQRKGAKGTIKEVHALVDAVSYVPKHVRLKVSFFWTTIKISNFKSGGLSDQLFVFPRSKYANGYKFVDKRSSSK